MCSPFQAFALVVCVLLATGLLPAKAADPQTSSFRTPPITLKAADILPATLLSGKNYLVKERVLNDGLINTYDVTTPYGTSMVEGTEQLMVRIQELNAIVVMEEMDRRKLFGDALVAGVKAPVRGAINLVKAPVETTRGAIAGAGRFLSNIGHSIMSDDPHEDNALKVAIGFDAAKRGFAYELGINPYSSYDPAMARLGQVAKASVAGGLAPRAAMAAVDSRMVTALRVTGTTEGLRKLIRDKPPGELEKINRAKLAGMGIMPSLVDTFMNNYAYDPQEKTFLVGALEQLEGVRDRASFIAAAGVVTRPSVAVFYRVMAQLMAGYHTRIAPAAGVGQAGTIPYLQRNDGTVIFILPLDYVFRTEPLAHKLRRIDEVLAQTGKVSSKELWLTGRVDGHARNMLQTAGWKITEKAGDRLRR